MKKTISFILAVLMLFSIVNVSVVAANIATPKATASNDVGGVKVYWNKVDGAVKYHVYRRVGGSSSWVLAGTTTGTLIIDKGVSNGKYYAYSVRAYDVNNNYSAYNAGMTYSVKCVATPKLTSLTNDTNGLKLTWSAVSGASYRVYRRGAGASTWTYLGTTNSTTFTDTKASSGKYWRYTVRAISNGYYSGFDTNGLFTMRLANPYSIKTSFGTNYVNVSWAKINGATGYRVYRRGAGEKSWTYLGATTTNYFKDTKITPNSYYRYTVRATNGKYMSWFYSEGSVICANIKNELVGNLWQYPYDYDYTFAYYPDGTGVITGGYCTMSFKYSVYGNRATITFVNGDSFDFYLITKSDSNIWRENDYFVDSYAPYMSNNEKFLVSSDAIDFMVKRDNKNINEKKAYYKVLLRCVEKWMTAEYNGYDYWYKEYAIHDINEDGVAELIVQDGTCEADRMYYFYTYKNGKAVYMGSYSASHSALADANRHLLFFSGHMGYATTAQIYMVNDKIVVKNRQSYYTDEYPDYGPYIEFTEEMA